MYRQKEGKRMIFLEIHYSKQVVKFLSRQDKIAQRRIIDAMTMMNDSDAEKVWNFVITNLSPKSWDDIEEVSPDEWDLKMLDEIDKNPRLP